MGMLDDRIAVVTGGRGGVGRAVCERFEAEGAIVYAGDLSDGGSVGGDAPAGSFLPLDVTDEAAVMASFAQVRQPLYASSKAAWKRYEAPMKPFFDTYYGPGVDYDTP